MEVTILQQENGWTARMAGRLDTPASLDVANQIKPMLEHADGTIVLDCSEMTYISSSGLRIFLTIRKQASVQGGHVIVSGLSDDIRQVFMMTGFLQLFDIQ
ncbi:MAG: STAS domain-containing protein [Bacteroidales bacterium]|nr:STAS domain-containing protein [Bacteroidales bacterium]